jgi:nucleotide-binding universal stress UspA family protein
VNTTKKAAIQRILLALDASPESVTALDTATELAGRLGADLTGLFVEDTDLLRMASLPFAAEIGRFSPSLRRLSLPEMERQMRAQAEHMRKAIAVAAAREGVKWEFRVARGSVAAQILLAGMQADLVILGKRGWSLSKRLGSSVQMVISQAQGLTLVLHPGIKFTIPVVVIYDGSEVARKGLDAAGNLVKIKDGNLRVIVIAKTREKSVELQ